MQLRSSRIKITISVVRVHAPQQVRVLERSNKPAARGIDVDLDLPPVLLVELLCMERMRHQQHMASAQYMQ